MTEVPETPSDVVARRVREVRKRLGWSAERLAAECVQVGAPHLTASVLANIESGRRDQQGRRRRDVTVDELLQLAAALRVETRDLLPSGVGKPYDEAFEATVTELLAELHRRGELLAEQRRQEGKADG
jgi:transcriptional regulator with XRE-family HTH domain